ncbi:MAG: type IV pilin N-terminal domain-containing protein [Candidatus Thermoplasmatota archaeon]|nr:type IV pilin N-terminal domain-containing protein [Candidatus Thermoplasmatota archaeon]
MKNKRKNAAVSEIIGTVLLLGITISLFAVLCVVVLAYPHPSPPPSVNLVGMVDNDYLIIEHRGGESLTLDTTVIISNETSTIRYTLKDVNISHYTNNSQWDVGEWISIYIGGISKADVAVIDKTTDSVIMTGRFKR